MEKHIFRKESMNTEIVLSIVCESLSYARSAAEDALFLLERIESALSAYMESSDVFAINSAKVDDMIKVSDYTMDCLIESAKIYDMTLGSVDVCNGAFFLNNKNQASAENPSRISLLIDNENFWVKKTSEGSLDFGAIGKGYAVDVLAKHLEECWSIKNALIDFGASSILALGKDENNQDWKISIDGKDIDLRLKNKYSIASSGTSVQGSHILDRNLAPVQEGKKISVIAPTALLADAFSTAFMILDSQEIDELSALYDLKSIII